MVEVYVTFVAAGDVQVHGSGTKICSKIKFSKLHPNNMLFQEVLLPVVRFTANVVC